MSMCYLAYCPYCPVTAPEKRKRVQGRGAVGAVTFSKKGKKEEERRGAGGVSES
jgi:hypothetical protein